MPRGMIFGRGGGLEICQLHASRTDGRAERDSGGHFENYIPRSSDGRPSVQSHCELLLFGSYIFYLSAIVQPQNGGLFFPKEGLCSGNTD